MARTFRDYWNDLMGDIPALDQFKAQSFINYAWRDIREARRWSFLSAVSSLDVPNQITTGLASVTQWSDTVVGNVTAKAAWDAVGVNLPLTDRQFRVGSGPLYQIISYDPTGGISALGNIAINSPPTNGQTLTVGNAVFTFVTANPTGFQILISGGSGGAQLQAILGNIIAAINAHPTSLCTALINGSFDTNLTAINPGTGGNSIALAGPVGTGGTIVLVTPFAGGVNSAATWNTGGFAGSLQLDRTFKETTNTVQGYSIYKAYHSPPSVDFIAFTTVKDIQNGRDLTLNLTREDLDRIDPQRQQFGDPYRVAVYSADTSGNVKIELHPHMLTAKSYFCEYEREGVDMTATDSLPRIIPESLLMEKALVYACRWANDNKARYDTLKDGNWQAASVMHDAAYTLQLRQVKILDEEQDPSDLSYAPDRVRRFGFGDTRYGQSHDSGDFWGGRY
jgi:hypothetical protein